MMNLLMRRCPNCGTTGISVLKLTFWRVRCPHCAAEVGTKPAWRMAILSMEMMVWLLALSWLYRDYGRTGLLLSFAVWAAVDLLADCVTPLVARRR